jgi:hypothetical protein
MLILFLALILFVFYVQMVIFTSLAFRGKGLVETKWHVVFISPIKIATTSYKAAWLSQNSATNFFVRVANAFAFGTVLLPLATTIVAESTAVYFWQNEEFNITFADGVQSRVDAIQNVGSGSRFKNAASMILSLMPNMNEEKEYGMAT